MTSSGWTTISDDDGDDNDDEHGFLVPKKRRGTDLIKELDLDGENLSVEILLPSAATHRSELPVSRTTSKDCAGVPIETVAEYEASRL